MTEGPSATDIASLLVGAASLAVAVVALVMAMLALRRSDRNASAGTLVSLNEAFTGAWQRYLADGANIDFEFGNLANLLEIGCAFHHEGSIHGASREILERYLGEVLDLIESHEEARARLKALRDDPDNFRFIVLFLRTRTRTRTRTRNRAAQPTLASMQADETPLEASPPAPCAGQLSPRVQHR